MTHSLKHVLVTWQLCGSLWLCLCHAAGFLLGTRQTLLETFDGGKTWQPRDIEAAKDEGFNYR